MERFVHFGFMMAALVIAGMSILLNGALTKSHESSQSLFQSYQVLNTLHAVREDYKSAENAATSYARSGDPAAKALQRKMLERTGAGIASLKALVPDNLAQQQRLHQVESRFRERMALLNADRENAAGAQTAVGAGTMYDSTAWKEREAFFSPISQMESEELRIFNERGQMARQRFSIAQKTLAGVVCGGMLLLAAVYFSLFNQMRARRRAEQLERESSSILRLTIDSVRGMMVYVDRQLRYKLHNRAYAELMGDANRSLVGAKVADVLGPDVFRETEPLINRALAGEAVQGQRKHVLSDGRVVDIQINFIPDFAESGEVCGFFGLHTDITEFKRKEAQLLEKTVFQKTILDSAHIAIVAGDTDGVIRLFNVGAERMLRYSADEVIGNADFSSLRFHDRQEVAEHAAALSREFGSRVAPDREALIAKARRGFPDENEWTYLRKDGSTVPVFVSVTALRTEQDDIVGYLALAFDITERKEAEAQLKQARAFAVDASRAKSAFLATMSHEIRTPLNGMVGMVEVLAHSRLSEYQADMVHTIRESAGVLLDLIDGILDFSKIEANRLSLERAPLSIADLVDGVCSSLLPLARKTGVELKIVLGTLLPERVLGDDIRLRQVLYNLIGNALKFSAAGPERGACVSVRAEVASAAPLRVAFTVVDNGIGMSPETVGRLFTPFMQAEASTTRRFGGTGLGLTICKRLVALMQGEIAVTSAVGKGSAFTVTLPFEPAPPEQPSGPPQRPIDSRARATMLAVPAAPLTVAEARAQGRFILVAEDNLINQKVILRQLELLGYAAEVAGSGMQALQRWREGSYALLLTDLHMPQLDGYGLTAAIRAEEHAERRLPILALTANASRGEAARARAAGMDEYLVKPVSLAALGATLERWLPQAHPQPAPAALAAAAPAPASARASAVDIAVLIALVGNDPAVVRELLSDFLASARQLKAQAGQAYEAGDTGKLGAIAHKLKSSSLAVGALALGDACATLETACKGLRKESVAESIAEFNAALIPVEGELVDFLSAEDYLDWETS